MAFCKFCGKQLKNKKHNNAPHATTETTDKFFNSSRLDTFTNNTPVSIKIVCKITNDSKNIKVVEVANPSRPSVKLTALDVAR